MYARTNKQAKQGGRDLACRHLGQCTATRHVCGKVGVHLRACDRRVAPNPHTTPAVNRFCLTLTASEINLCLIGIHHCRCGAALLFIGICNCVPFLDSFRVRLEKSLFVRCLSTKCQRCSLTRLGSRCPLQALGRREGGGAPTQARMSQGTTAMPMTIYAVGFNRQPNTHTCKTIAKI